MPSLPLGIDPCSVPAAVPPDGVTPNFADPIDLTVPTLVVGSVITVLSTSLCIGRLYVSWGNMKMADCKFNFDVQKIQQIILRQT